MPTLAQLTPSIRTNDGTAFHTGSDVATWADSPAKLAAVWIGGLILLVAIIVFVIKFKNDHQ